MSIIQVFKKRRSQYALSNTLPVSLQQVQDIISQCVLQTPSAFNMQSARVVVLVGGKHIQLWKMVLDILQAQLTAEQQVTTANKINSFAAAYGTILYFEDQETITQLQEKFTLYKDNFPVWAQQANGMLQFAVWSALAEVGVGASLQHYNPLIDAAVAKAFSIPATWKLVAQMPFGQITSPAADKTYLPLSTRLRIEK